MELFTHALDSTSYPTQQSQNSFNLDH